MKVQNNFMINKMYSYTLSHNYHPEITEKFDPLIKLLQEEWDIYSVKPLSKTMRNITQTKIALEITRSFIWENNWKLPIYL
jgi:uncharacterized membrane protein YheB (UPF0754 family)